MSLGVHIRRAGTAREPEWRIYPGDGPQLEPVSELPPGRRMIFIPAVPSSGTSCVAGVLHHLGVDMGNVREENPRRGYAMYEDVDVGMFTFTPNAAPLDSLLSQRIRLREYANYRFYKSEGPVGVKTLSTAWIYDRDPASLPVEILDVWRPLEVAEVSDLRRMAGRPLRDPNEIAATAFQQINRAGGVAACWVAKLLFYQILPPKHSVSFDAVRESPEKEIDELIEAFELEPSKEQRFRAIASVRRTG